MKTRVYEVGRKLNRSNNYEKEIILLCDRHKITVQTNDNIFRVGSILLSTKDMCPGEFYSVLCTRKYIISYRSSVLLTIGSKGKMCGLI